MPNKYSKTLGHSSSSSRRKRRNSHLRRDLQSRNFNRQKKTRRLKIFLLLIIVLIALGLLTYFLLFSSFFTIKKVQVSKLVDYDLIKEQEVIEKVYSLMNKKRLFCSRENIFIFKTASLADVLEQDSRIADFTISKNFSQKELKIDIKESLPIAKLISFSNYQNYYLNEKGEAIYLPQQDFTTLEQEKEQGIQIQEQEIMEIQTQEKGIIKSEQMPLFYDYTEVSLSDPVYVEFLKDILDLINSPVLEQRQIRAELIKITKDKSIFEAEIGLNEGWLIFINSEADFELQKNNLSTILNKELLERDNIEYIDLKFGQRIFYKPKQGQEKEY